MWGEIVRKIVYYKYDTCVCLWFGVYTYDSKATLVSVV
jgi:hypothetical protein